MRNGETGVIAVFEQRPNHFQNTALASLIQQGQVGLIDNRAPDLSIDEIVQLILDETTRLSAHGLQASAGQALIQQKSVLAVVAHELRNPLTPISLIAERMVRLPSDQLPRVRELIESQVRHISQLVEGTITLSASIDSDVLEIRISDDGIGISPSLLPFIFNPYVQDEHAIGFNGNGLGIGLTVVRELIEAHGGKVTAASQGNGWAVSFW